MALRDTTNHINDALSALSAALAADALAKEAAQAQGGTGATHRRHIRKACRQSSQLYFFTLPLHSPPRLLHAYCPLRAACLAQHVNDPETKQKLLAAVDDAESEFPRIADALQRELSGDAKDQLGPANSALRDVEKAQALIARIVALSTPTAAEESVALGSKADDALGMYKKRGKKRTKAKRRSTSYLQHLQRICSTQPKKEMPLASKKRPTNWRRFNRN